MPLNQNLAQRCPNEEYAYESPGPLWWSDDERYWMSCDPVVLLAIFKNANFAVIDCEKEKMKIVDGLGVDLLATAKAARHLPLAKEGCAHASLRRQMALEINRRTAPALLSLEGYVRSKVRAIFFDNRHFDIVAELFAPLVANLVTALSGVRVDSRTGKTSPSQLFDRGLSLNRRKIINDQIIELYDGAQPDHDETSSVDLGVALAVLGFDTLLGSIGESFLHEIRANPDKPMNEICWSDSIPVTGVPHVDRIAVKSVAVGGVEIKSSQRIRLYMDAFKGSGAGHQDLYFGAGRHGCLGRSIAQKSWQILVCNLGAIRKRVGIAGVAYRPSDTVFNCPTSIMVSVGESQH